MEPVKLTDALADLRRELYEANKAGQQEDIQLEITEIDVEFAVEIIKGTENSGKLGFNVLVAQGEVKTGADTNRAHSHRIRLHLRPTLKKENLRVAATGQEESD